MSKAVYIFIVIFGCAFLSVEYASASPVTTNTTKIKQKTKRKTLDSVHASVTTRVESNVYDPSDSSSWLRGSLWLNPSIDLDKKNSNKTDSLKVSEVRVEGSKVIITTTGMTVQPTERYQVLLKNVQDLKGNTIVPNLRKLTVVQ